MGMFTRGYGKGKEFGKGGEGVNIESESYQQGCHVCNFKCSVKVFKMEVVGTACLKFYRKL